MQVSAAHVGSRSGNLFKLTVDITDDGITVFSRPGKGHMANAVGKRQPVKQAENLRGMSQTAFCGNTVVIIRMKTQLAVPGLIFQIGALREKRKTERTELGFTLGQRQTGLAYRVFYDEQKGFRRPDRYTRWRT